MNARTSLRHLMDRHLEEYSRHHRLSAHQWQVCHHVRRCRTPALGGMHLQCDHCDNHPTVYHACRDRHCPRCQRQASEAWCEKQKTAALPVTYHHLVFTLPQAIDDWVQEDAGVIYALLFQRVWATLSAFGQDPKRLDGQLGITAVLHTWGQTLVRHVHLHILCPGGAFGHDGAWHPAKSSYLFPVRALSRHFRGGFVSALRQRAEHGEFSGLGDEKALKVRLDALMDQDWVVYSKPALSYTDELVQYLARYSHKIALSDSRLQITEKGQLQLKYKDYRDDLQKQLPLEPQELIRSNLLHVLPKGFMRIRHYGFLANRCRNEKLPAIRRAIDQAAVRQPDNRVAKPRLPTPAPEPRIGSWPCKRCHQGRLWVMHTLPPQRLEGG